jgi:hypothetical protein
MIVLFARNFQIWCKFCGHWHMTKLFSKCEEIYPGSRGSLRGEINERRERGEPLVTPVANPTSTLD